MANLSNINNKFIVEDSGDVGIGVTTATTKLHIGGTAPGDSIIRQDSTVSGTNWEIGERAAGKWQIFEDDGDSIVATFMSTGKVGIGTNSPDEKLTIDGTTSGAYVRISNVASGDISSGYTIYNGSNLDFNVYTNPTFGNTTLLSREALAIRAGSAQRMYIRADGGVAIGGGNTGYSSQILSVKSDTADNVFYGESSDANCFASFRDSNSTANIEFGAIGNSHVFRKDTSIKMVIDGDGNVGIGTDSLPSDHRLQIHNAGAAYSRFALTNSSTGVASGDGLIFQMETLNSIIKNQENGSLAFGTNGRETDLFIKSDGKVGIGTSSNLSGPLTVQSDGGANSIHINGRNNGTADESVISFYDFDGTTRKGYILQTGGYMYFATGGSSTAITIDSSQNVGIGTTTPERVLDVKSNSDTAPSAYLRGGKSSQGEIQYTGLIVGTQTDMVAGDYQGISFTGYTSASAIARGRAAIGVEAINGPGKMDLVFMTRYADDGSQLTSADEKMRITGGGKVNIGQGTSITGFLNIEQSGNHIHLRNGAATSGKYWNFDVASNNRLYILNNGNTGVYIADGATSWTAQSDESLKENIKPLNSVLDKIKDYRCVEYNLKSDDSKDKKIGFIAQDWVDDFAPIISKDDDGLLGMKYTETIPILLKAIQELKAEIELLKSK